MEGGLQRSGQYNAQAAMVSEARVVGSRGVDISNNEIEQLVNVLHDCVTQVSDQVSEIEARLSLVLAPQPKEAGGSAPNAPCRDTELGNRLESLALRINILSSALNSINSRIRV